MLNYTVFNYCFNGFLSGVVISRYTQWNDITDNYFHNVFKAMDHKWYWRMC